MSTIKTTTTTANKVQPSKAILKANTTIKAVNAKENTTYFDIQKLANAHFKIEFKSISYVYKLLKNEYKEGLSVTKPTELQKAIIRLVSSKGFPSFASFKNAYKGSPCVWFGLSALRKLNPKAVQEAKAKRQNSSAKAKAEGRK